MFDFNMDAHMHFDLYQEKREIMEYVKQHKSYTIAVTNLPDLYKKYKIQYGVNKYFQLALGFHPELVAQFKNQIHLFKEMVGDTRFIGEIGLDFSRIDKDDIADQIEVFEKILNWCSGKNKILSVHCKSASGKVVDMIENFDGRVILHWFSGSIYVLQRAIKLGCFFSVNHQMLYTANGRKIIENIPVNRILIESDAPFTRGMEKTYNLEFNEILFKYIAELYQQDIDIVKKRIKANFAEVLK